MKSIDDELTSAIVNVRRRYVKLSLRSSSGMLWKTKPGLKSMSFSSRVWNSLFPSVLRASASDIRSVRLANVGCWARSNYIVHRSGSRCEWNDKKESKGRQASTTSTKYTHLKPKEHARRRWYELEQRLSSFRSERLLRRVPAFSLLPIHPCGRYIRYDRARGSLRIS